MKKHKKGFTLTPKFGVTCRRQGGFTLIELLIVIGIISILASIVYVAVDPAKRLKQARDTERWSSARAIVDAFIKFEADNEGKQPVTVVPPPWPGPPWGTFYMIGTDSTYEGTCRQDPGITGMVNLADGENPALGGLVDGYLASMPFDPSMPEADEGQTHYWIGTFSQYGRIYVGSCNREVIDPRDDPENPRMGIWIIR